MCDSCSLSDAENRDFPHTYCVVCGKGPFHQECLQGILCTVCATITDDPAVPEETPKVVPETTPEVEVEEEDEDPAKKVVVEVEKEKDEETAKKVVVMVEKEVVEKEKESIEVRRRSSRVAKRKAPDSPPAVPSAPTRRKKKEPQKVIQSDIDLGLTDSDLDPDSESGLEDFTGGLEDLCRKWSTKRLHFQVTDGLAPGCILAFLPFASDLIESTPLFTRANLHRGRPGCGEEDEECPRRLPGARRGDPLEGGGTQRRGHHPPAEAGELHGGRACGPPQQVR